MTPTGFVNKCVEKAVEFVIEKAASNVITTLDDHKIKSIAKAELEQVYSNIPEDIQFDPTALNDLLVEHMDTTVAACFNAPSYQQRDAAKRDLLHNACLCANADTFEKRQAVGLYIRVVMELVEQTLLEKVDDKEWFLHGHTLDEIRRSLRQYQEKLSKELSYKGSFEKWVDSILPPVEHEKDPFHYRNNILRFHGREQEIDILNRFLKASDSLLWMALTGAGGSGKSKLLYHFTQSISWNPDWRVLWMKYDQIAHADATYMDDWSLRSNLLVVVDYAGLAAEPLGHWLYHLSRIGKERRPNKLRFVLLEREEIGSNIPMWYNQLTSENRYEIERLCWQPEGKRTWSLGVIPDEILCEIAQDYAEHIGKPLTGDQKETIIQHIHRIEQKQTSPRPLILIFLTDALLRDENCRSWDTDKLLEYLVGRYRNHWRKELCNGANDLDNIVELLMVCATATDGLSLDKKPEILEDAEWKRFSSLKRAKLYLPLLHGLNGRDDEGNQLFPLEPDLLGEAFVLAWIQEQLEQYNQDLVKTLSKQVWESPTEFAIFLSRCIDDFGAKGKLAPVIKKVLPLLQPEDENRVGITFYARIHVHLTAKQPTAEDCAEVVNRLKDLYDYQIENSEVAVEYAKGLVNLSAKQPSAEDCAETINRLKDLYHCQSQNPEVAAEYAKGLFNLSIKQPTAEDRAEVVNRLKDLYDCQSQNPEIAVAYARGLVNLSATQLTAKDCAETINRLKDLYDCQNQNSEVAAAYVKGLFNLSDAQTTAEDCAEVVNRLHDLYDCQRENPVVAVEYAKGLFNLSNKQPTVEKHAEVVNRLHDLYDCQRKNPEVATVYAYALFNLSIKQPTAEDCAEVVNRLKDLYDCQSQNSEVAATYAYALFNLSNAQTTAEKRAEVMNRLQALCDYQGVDYLQTLLEKQRCSSKHKTKKKSTGNG